MITMELAVGGGPSKAASIPEDPMSVVLAKLASLANALGDHVSRTEALEAENRRLQSDLVEMRSGGPVSEPPKPQPSADDLLTLVNRMPSPQYVTWGGIREAIPAYGEVTKPRWFVEHARFHSGRWLAPDAEAPVFLLGFRDGVLGVERDTDRLDATLAAQFLRAEEMFLIPSGYAPRKGVGVPAVPSDAARPPLPSANVGVAVAAVNS